MGWRTAMLAAVVGCSPGSDGFEQPDRERPPGVTDDSDPMDDTEVDTDVEDSGTPPTDTDTDTDTDTGDTDTDTDTDTGTPLPAVCDKLPPYPLDVQLIPNIMGGEELHFDANGHLVNYGDLQDAFFTTIYGQAPVLQFPYASWEIAGVRVMMDGDLAVADEGANALMRIRLSGAQEPILTGIMSPNSVAIDDKGFVYVTAYDQILRVDPETGDNTLVIGVPGADLDGLTFSPDFGTLYFNHDDGGTVASVDIDAEGNGVDPRILHTFPGWGELDGMAVDVCGNLYVVRMDGLLRRIRTDGTIDGDYLDLGNGVNSTAVNFGSGIGDWKRDHLYIMDRAGGVYEANAGVDGKWEPHLPAP